MHALPEAVAGASRASHGSRRVGGLRHLAATVTVAAATCAVAVAVPAGPFGSAVRAGAAPKHAGQTGRKHDGRVTVLSAGSLETIMKTAVGPGFRRATGYTVTDVSHGSTGLAQDIKGGVYRADVFLSASATADKALEGAANGNWVRWYITFAVSPLVLGYEKSSKFAASIRSEPWWRVLTEPGILVGRTNPVTDPKGRLAVAALKEAAAKKDAPALAAIATKPTTVFTETSLVGRLQSGQLDAGFFYAVEASAAHFPTVPLTGVTEDASYTLTVVAKAPHPAAADALVAWLLSSKAKKLLAADGLHELRHPRLSGQASAVPKALRRRLR